MSHRDRRSFLKFTAGTAGMIAAPGILRAQTSSSAPIKVGVNLPLSGVFALVGQEANKGINMYVDSINKTAAGRKLEVFFEDETVQVNTAVTKARKLLESDRVHALLGGASTPVIYATAALIEKEKVPYIVTVGGGAEITRKSKRNPFTFRTSYNIWGTTYPFAQWVAKNGIKKVYIFCPGLRRWARVRRGLSGWFYRGWRTDQRRSIRAPCHDGLCSLSHQCCGNQARSRFRILGSRCCDPLSHGRESDRTQSECQAAVVRICGRLRYHSPDRQRDCRIDFGPSMGLWFDQRTQSSIGQGIQGSV